MIGRPPHGVSRQWAVLVRYGMRRATGASCNAFPNFLKNGSESSAGAKVPGNESSWNIRSWQANFPQV